MGNAMTDPDTSKFERIVKRLLATPPKPREEMKMGKTKRKSRKSLAKRSAKKRR